MIVDSEITINNPRKIDLTQSIHYNTSRHARLRDTLRERFTVFNNTREFNNTPCAFLDRNFEIYRKPVLRESKYRRDRNRLDCEGAPKPPLSSPPPPSPPAEVEFMSDWGAGVTDGCAVHHREETSKWEHPRDSSRRDEVQVKIRALADPPILRGTSTTDGDVRSVRCPATAVRADAKTEPRASRVEWQLCCWYRPAVPEKAKCVHALPGSLMIFHLYIITLLYYACLSPLGSCKLLPSFVSCVVSVPLRTKRLIYWEILRKIVYLMSHSELGLWQ